MKRKIFLLCLCVCSFVLAAHAETPAVSEEKETAQENSIAVPIKPQSQMLSTKTKVEGADEEIELVTDVSDIFKGKDLSAIQVVRAKLLKAESGALEFEIKNGSLKGKKSVCQLSRNTKGITYGYANDDDMFAALMAGNLNLLSKKDADDKLATHIGKEIKVGFSEDQCTYFEFIESE